MKLTSNFSLEELSHTDHREFDNTPPADVIPNLRRLAMILEQVRSLFNNQPGIVNSAYRSFGSSNHSQHLFGCAADIRIPNTPPDMVMQAILAANLPYDQLLREFDAWVHISVPTHEGETPRKMALIIDKTGTRAYA